MREEKKMSSAGNDTRSKKAVMQDIARELGISIVSVSNAMNGRKGVGSTLHDAIIQKAQEVGYSLPAKKKEEGKRTFIVGVICSRQYISEGSSFYWEMYQHVASHVAKRGALTMLEIFEDKEKISVMPSLLERDDVDGIIVIGRMYDEIVKMIIEKKEGKVILLDFSRPWYSCDAVLSANYSGMYRSVSYLADRGHTRIGFVGSIRTSRNVMERYYGYCRCMMERGLPICEEYLLEDRDPDTEEGRVLLSEKLPTAFACASDYTAGLLLEALSVRGLQVPEDISVTGYDDYLYGNAFARVLTTYHVDMEKMAFEAVRLLFKRMNGLRTEMGIHYVDNCIVERKSVKRL